MFQVEIKAVCVGKPKDEVLAEQSMSQFHQQKRKERHQSTTHTV